MSTKYSNFLFYILIILFFGFCASKIIHFNANDKCLQCKQIYGDAKLNIPRRFLATPQTFEKFFLGECYEMEMNKVPYWVFCYDLYNNHTKVLYNSIIEKIHEDSVCAQINYCS
uniref:Saposin B-type domain-containing protein n=1 Tax=Panagrolaimus sp. PS1159 TaxID=55785 RepID=A0AC35F4D0_9BILA